MEKKTEKFSPREKKTKIEIETEIGVPNPPVPNRAHTEMSTKDTLSDKLKHDTKRSQKE